MTTFAAQTTAAAHAERLNDDRTFGPMTMASVEEDAKLLKMSLVAAGCMRPEGGGSYIRAMVAFECSRLSQGVARAKMPQSAIIMMIAYLARCSEAIGIEEGLKADAAIEEAKRNAEEEIAEGERREAELLADQTREAEQALLDGMRESVDQLKDQSAKTYTPTDEAQMMKRAAPEEMQADLDAARADGEPVEQTASTRWGKRKSA